MKRIIHFDDKYFSDFNGLYYLCEGKEFDMGKTAEVIDWEESPAFSLKIRTQNDHDIWIAFPFLAYECEIKRGKEEA